MKKALMILLILVLVLKPAFSQELYQYAVTAEIFENNTVNYKLNLILVNNPTQRFIFPIGSPSDVSVNSTADCSAQQGTLETNIVCLMEASNRTDIIVTYKSDGKVNKKDNYFLFTDSFKLATDTDNVFVLVKLPEGTGLKEPIENSYSPEGALIGSDGRRTIISWQKNNLKAGETFDVSIGFENIGEVVTSSIPLEVIVIVLIVIALSFIIFYRFYLRKESSMKIIFPILKKDEKMIFDTIMKHGNGVNQKIIVRDSGYSKAKVSKVLTSLKERGLVKLERLGRSNKVHIEKKFEKKA